VRPCGQARLLLDLLPRPRRRTPAFHGQNSQMSRKISVDLFHVPYRGAQVFPALLAGDVQVYFGPLLSSIEHIRSSKLRALAVTTTTRSNALAEVPVLVETLPGFEASAWYGIGAPKNTPADIVGMLNTAINAGLSDPHLKSLLVNLSGTVLPGSPADFRKLIVDETEKWRKLIQKAKIKLT